MSRSDDPPAHGDRHALDPMSYWEEREQEALRRCERLAGSGRVDLRARMTAELELGLLRTHLGRDRESVARPMTMALDCAAALALARVAAPRGGFSVELRWPAPDGGEDYVALPAADNGFGWPDWLDAFALALLSEDHQALTVLGSAGCVDACALPFAAVDRFWPLLCGGFAALRQGHSAAAGLLDDAEALLERVSVMDPERAAALIRPLLPLARAVDARDAGAAARSAEAAFAAHRAWFAAQADGSRAVEGLFAPGVSALLAEAGRRGLEPMPDSDYRLPAFRRAEPAAALVLLYPRLGILSAVEAEWLLEQEGFSRHERGTVGQEGDRLLARYRAYGGPGIPAAELEFELLDAERDEIHGGGHAPPALDVGELLHRAEILAGGPAAGGERVLDLPGAVEAVDLAIAYVDAMPRGFDPATLHSAVGEALWRDEPGRFRRERMIVYRDALARQAGLRERGADPVPPGPSEAGTAPRGAPEPPGPRAPSPVPGAPEARRQVLELVEALTPLVLPTLEAIVLGDGEAVRTLLPGDDDYALAFTGDAVAAAREHYGTWWPRQLEEGVAPAVDPGWRVEAHLAPAGLLGSDNELSRPFPRGYRTIAPWLDPRRVWVCWHYRPPEGGSGIAMNGLVWLDDHWAWFPKPYRLVPALRGR